MHRVPAVWRRMLLLLLLVPGLLAVRLTAQRALRHELPRPDWPQFGGDPASSSVSLSATGITAANVSSLNRLQVRLDGTVDSSAIYLHDVTIGNAVHDTFFVTTTYGKTIAVDADTGGILWEFTPTGFATWAGTAQITNSTPAADPDRLHIYAAAPDGTVQKLNVADGRVVWSTAVTLLPSREKLTSPLKIYRGRLIVVTGGYIGDAPPYQGHVAIVDTQTGALLHVWNSLCSDRPGLIQPSSCASTRSAIWGRSGAIIDPSTGNIFVATGNGPYNGKTDWGDAFIELDPDATRILANYTPSTNATLDSRDLDLGSTSPILLAPGVVAQGGKDSLIRVLALSDIAGTDARIGNERQSVPTPSRGLMFTAAGVWSSRAGIWLFAADGGAVTAWRYAGGQLTQVWSNPTGGTSPILAGRLLYVYSANGGLHVYNPLTGAQVALLACGGGHWNSPIVVDNRIALPEGDANSHALTGILNIWK